jgi:hypothetical protein
MWGCKTKPPQKEIVVIQFKNLVYPKHIKNAHDSVEWLLPRSVKHSYFPLRKNAQDSLWALLNTRSLDSIIIYKYNFNIDSNLNFNRNLDFNNIWENEMGGCKTTE